MSSGTVRRTLSAVGPLGCVALLAAGCAVGKAETVVDPPGVKSLIPPATTVNYCSPGGQPLTMDLWLPAASTGPSPRTTPVVIFAHGGGWVGHDRTIGVALAGAMPRLLEKGIAFASIDYRLFRPVPDPTVPSAASIPEIVTDAACAVRFMRANAGRWHIDPQRIGTMGESAGAHLMSMVGLADANLGLDVGEWLDESSTPQAVATYAGPADLTIPNNFNRHPGVLAGFGATSVQDPVMKTWSPVTWVSPDDPPFLIVQGDADDSVELGQAQDLYERLGAAGVRAEIVAVHRGTHGFDAIEEEPASPAIFQRTVDFFVKHLGGPR